jgi:hypothetical protein
MLLQFRLVRQQAVQTAIEAGVVDLVRIDPQQIVQRRRGKPALLDGQFAARSAQPVDGQHSRHLRPGHIGLVSGPVQQRREQAVQLQLPPQLQTQKTLAEAPRTFQPHAIDEHLRHLLVVPGRSHVGGKQLQLPALALRVEDFDGLQPARLCRAVQLAQITQRTLPRTRGRPRRFHQRPIRMRLAVFPSPVRAQKHAARILPRPHQKSRG